MCVTKFEKRSVFTTFSDGWDLILWDRLCEMTSSLDISLDSGLLALMFLINRIQISVRRSESVSRPAMASSALLYEISG